MLLLLTNDDGVDAPGLWALIHTACRFTDIETVVVAPDRERSATGHAISIHQPVEVRQHRKDRRLRLYSTGGTPADCVKVAVEGILGRLPDFVISGVNRGPNLGQDVFYSGTVSAAMEGAFMGIRAMAVSVTAFENLDYGSAASFAVDWARRSHDEEEWPALVNVNVPAIPGESISGVAVTRLGRQRYRDVFMRRTDPRGRTWFWLGGTVLEGDAVEDTDICAISRNLISVTPLTTDLTDFAGIESLAGKALTWPDRA